MALTDLNPQQQAVIHWTACRMVTAAASPALQPTDTTLAAEADVTVAGVFVTLKIDGKLRGCYGTFGGALQLSNVLQQAATGAANKDPRFPKLKLDELDRLHVEVSLLHNIQPIRAEGRGRAAAIQLGRHGLVIRKGNRSGLLLPRVATDFGLDAEGFLRQICKKAGLRESDWLSQDTRLDRFEAACFGGPYANDPPQSF